MADNLLKPDASSASETTDSFQSSSQNDVGTAAGYDFTSLDYITALSHVLGLSQTQDSSLDIIMQAPASSEESVAVYSHAMPNLSNNMAQWHLDNPGGVDVNLNNVWEAYTGKGVTVGVMDDGVGYGHSDLNNNYNAALDYNVFTKKGNGVNTSTAQGHGTSVSGVIAAENDGKGTIGIAFESKFTSFKVLGGSVNSTQLNDIFGKQANVAVSNNSWGFDAFAANNLFIGGGVENTLQTVVNTARGGLGTVFVFSAGNSRIEGDNANYREMQNTRFGITVAAGDEDGIIANFSSPGACVLLTAPGVNIVTTDLVKGGFSSTGQYATVNGTSFSAPIVSGAVALMLEANPGLGYRDVQEILAYSSFKTDTGNTSWEWNGATNWNGGNMHVSEDYGFGYLDISAAVGLAETWNINKTADKFSDEVSVTANSGTINLALSDLTTRTSVLNVASGIEIDHVEVFLNMSHTKIGDLVVKLTSPDGTESTLMNRALLGNSTATWGSTWSLSSTQHWGETGVGNWTLSVYDATAGNTGTLTSWTLKLYGDTASNDDVYVYTDEFSNFTGDAGRKTITDAAGNDVLNAGAVSSNVTLNLAPGAVSNIAGNTVTINAATTIENAAGGSGNDSITGNTVNNILMGGRGDDTLYGLGGVDTLKGGAGNDTLDGGAGTDSLVGGLGDDTYLLDSTSETAVEGLNQGADTIVIASTYTLGANLENLTLTGSANLNGTGNTLHNVLTGNSGNNILDGGTGNDTLIGGAGVDTLIGGMGNDTYEIDSASDVITETSSKGGIDTIRAGFNYTLGTYFENLELLGSGNLNGTGNTYHNLIKGNSGNNLLDGGTGGNDTMDGGAGADTLIGGTGNDAYFVDNAGDVVTEAAGAGTDTVYSTLTYTLGANLEKLTLLGTGNINATGNTLNNTLTGNSGNNILNGGAGNDVMAGGAGNDTYYADSSKDVVKELKDAGTDHVYSSATFTIAANIENLTLQGSANINGNGNSLNNVITGNSGNNSINASSGNDTLIGGNGNDTLIGGGGNDTYTSFSAGFGHDIISDASGADVLNLSAFNLVSATFTAIDGIDKGTNVDSLKISFAGGSYSITIQNYFSNTHVDDDFSNAGKGHIETIIFADDPLVNLAQVKALIA